jgi:hypothetical protein
MSKSAATSASSPSRVELVDEGNVTLIFSKLISSSKFLIQSGLFKEIVIVRFNSSLPFRFRTLKAELPSKNVTHILSSTNLMSITSPKFANCCRSSSIKASSKKLFSCEELLIETNTVPSGGP